MFLEAGFVAKDKAWSQRADLFRRQFEDLLRCTVKLSDRVVSDCVLASGEAVTDFTAAAERESSCLSGIPIDSSITEQTKRLRGALADSESRELLQSVRCLNERAMGLVRGLIAFKENILNEVCACRLFTGNYPLMIEHILREARRYRDSLANLMQENPQPRHTEDFWNQIMMEHSLFIRGLLDPSEEALIQTANQFSQEYRKLLSGSEQNLKEKSLAETQKLKEFKTAGTKGMIECQISSIMLPLLADHVLREANHYIRILSPCSA